MKFLLMSNLAGYLTITDSDDEVKIGVPGRSSGRNFWGWGCIGGGVKGLLGLVGAGAVVLAVVGAGAVGAVGPRAVGAGVAGPCKMQLEGVSGRGDVVDTYISAGAPPGSKVVGGAHLFAAGAARISSTGGGMRGRRMRTSCWDRGFTKCRTGMTR